MAKLLNLLYVGVTRARAVLSIPSELHEVLANAMVLRGEYKELIC
jgi:ATP-dependent exoDNAse (exonuclease V) alpha subunit